MRHTGFILLLVLFMLTLCTIHAASAREDYAAIVEKDCETCHIESYYPGGDFFEAESVYKHKIFKYSTETAALIFLIGIINIIILWRRGKSPSLKGKFKWGPAMRAVLTEAIIGRKILKISFIRWSVFIGISMGFLALFIVFLIFYFFKTTIGLDYLEPSAFQLTLDFLFDFFGILIMIGIIMSIMRRYIIKSPQMENLTQDTVALLFVFLIILSGFLLEGFRFATLPPSPSIEYSFIGNIIGSFLKSFNLPWTIYHFYLWIFHGCISVAFVAYIPFGKIRHFIACPISIAAAASDEAHTKTC